MSLRDYLRNNDIHFVEEVPLKTLTGMNLRGQLPVVAYPDSIEKLKGLMQFVISHSNTYEVLGGITNTYLCEDFKRDIVILTVRIKDFDIFLDYVSVGCGLGLSALSMKMIGMGYRGFEWMACIPGTVGGAFVNNSGAFGCEMSEVVKGGSIIDSRGNVIYLSKDELKYTKRNSALKGRAFGAVLSVDLCLSEKGNPEELKTIVSNYRRIRRQRVDGNRKSLGSVIEASTLRNLWKYHKLSHVMKRMICGPINKTWYSRSFNTWMEFAVLGIPSMAKHCDSIGRFCWTDQTTERDFYQYIETMQRLAHNELYLEIEIKR